MSDPSEPMPGAGSAESLDEIRTKRWTSEMSDVPASFDRDQLLRAIAANTRIQAQAAKTTAGWVTVIGLVVLGQVILLALVVLGGVSIETTNGF